MGARLASYFSHSRGKDSQSRSVLGALRSSQNLPPAHLLPESAVRVIASRIANAELLCGSDVVNGLGACRHEGSGWPHEIAAHNGKSRQIWLCHQSKPKVIQTPQASPHKHEIQPQPRGNNYNSNPHLMQHLHGACVVASLLATVEKVLEMWHLEPQR